MVYIKGKYSCPMVSQQLKFNSFPLPKVFFFLCFFFSCLVACSVLNLLYVCFFDNTGYFDYTGYCQLKYWQKYCFGLAKANNTSPVNKVSIYSLKRVMGGNSTLLGSASSVFQIQVQQAWRCHGRHFRTGMTICMLWISESARVMRCVKRGFLCMFPLCKFRGQ